MKIIKSNGLLITFPLVWLIIAVSDVVKGKPADAAFDVVLAVVLLMIPPLVDRIRRDAQKVEDNPFERLSDSVENLKQTIIDEFKKLIDQVAKLLGGSK